MVLDSRLTIVIASANNIRRISLLDALGTGREDWDHVIERCPRASPFMGWGWHSAWARAASPEEVAASFAVVLEGPDEGVQALLPLSVRAVSFRRANVRALTWAAGGVGCPDHLDVPAVPGADVEALVPALEALPWDLIAFTGVADDAANVKTLTDAFARRGYPVRRAVLDTCPYLDLSENWEEYLTSLGPTRRQTIRRKERKLMREHAGRITDYDSSRIDDGWNWLRVLHEERWGGPGALGAPLLERLIRCFASDLAARDELWLTTFDLDGAPAAAWCGFAWRDTVYFYQSGRDPKWERESVGQVLMGAMIRRAIEQGFRRFDFLRGRDAYKFAWTSTSRPVHEVVVFRPGWRGTWLRGLDTFGRARARLRSRPEFAVNDA